MKKKSAKQLASARQWKKDNPIRVKKMRKRWNEANREKARAHAKRQRELHPDRCKARTTIKNAIRDGRIKRKPCVICGSTKSESHHDDYSKPFDVRWFCRKHHDIFHRRIH